MLEIIWRNPKRQRPRRLAVLRVVTRDKTDFQLRSVYRSVSDTEEAQVLYELLKSQADAVCAA